MAAGNLQRDLVRTAPERSVPERGTSRRGTSERGTPERGTSERGAPGRGTSERGTPERGTSERGAPGRGRSERGTPERGTPERGTPERTTTRDPADSAVLGSRLLVADLRAAAPAWTPPERVLDSLRRATPDGWRVHVVRSLTVSDGDGADRPSDETLSVIGDAEAYLGFGAPRALLEAAPGLRWIHSATAGVGSLLTPELRARELLLTNSAGVHAQPIAEYVLGGVLHFLRGLDIAVRLQAEGRWDREPFVGAGHSAREVGECRVLVVGTGGIGGAVGRALSALGAHCVGIRRRPELGAPTGFIRVVGLDGLDDELPSADVLVLAAPLTSQTRALISAERLDRLPPGAIVVNVARGALLDEQALAEQLESGKLRGAVLDVFEEEPLPADSPLWGKSRALLSPHVSGVSPRRFWERELALILDNWRRYRAGEPLRNLVDQRAGY